MLGSSLSTTMMASGETWRAYLLKKTPKSEPVLAERATTFELWTPFEARGRPAADPAAGTETMPADGRLLRVDVVWPRASAEQKWLSPTKIAGRRRGPPYG